MIKWNGDRSDTEHVMYAWQEGHRWEFTENCMSSAELQARYRGQNVLFVN